MNKEFNQELELNIQRGIRNHENTIVILIENAFNNTFYRGLEEAQFRNLVRVSETTESTEAIRNFLRYQVGRDMKWGRGEESLAERIVTDIGKSGTESQLYRLAKDITDKAFNNVTRASDYVDVSVEKSSIQYDFALLSEYLQSVWIELTRRYLGYGSRRLKYINLLLEKGLKQAKSEAKLLADRAVSESTSSDVTRKDIDLLLRVVRDIDNSKDALKLKDILSRKMRPEKWGKGRGSLAYQVLSDIGEPSKESLLWKEAKKVCEPIEISEFKPVWLELVEYYLESAGHALRASSRK